MFLFLSALLLWGTNLIEPCFVMHYYDQTPMVLYKPLMAVQNLSPLAGQVFAIVLVAVSIICLVKVNSSIRLIEKNSMFYILLYIIFQSSLQDFKQLNPMLPALIFHLLGCASLFRMYKQERELARIFECGLFFSIASLFYAPAIYFSILLFLGLMIMVPFYWRQWFAALIGFALPILLVFAISFCLDSFSSQVEVWKVNLQTLRVADFNYLYPIVFSIYLALLVILSAIYSFSGGIKKVATRKYYLFFGFYLALVLFGYFGSPYVGYEFLYFGVLPVVVYVSNYMVNIRSKAFAEVLFLLILVATVMVQVFPDVVLNF